MRQLHQDKLFNCFLCEQDFDSSENLNAHMRSMHDQSSYNCGECGETFDRERTLSEHVGRAHEGNRYTCERCGKTSESSRTLRTHIETIHKGDRRHSRQQFNFNRDSNLKRGTRTTIRGDLRNFTSHLKRSLELETIVMFVY